MYSRTHRPLELLLATTNPHKVREIKAILDGLPLDFHSRRDFPDWPEIIEDGKTIRANALKKARVLARHTGMLTLADDSGLEVDCLRGKPGVRSARFSGRSATDCRNIKKVLSLMEGIPRSGRAARFRCVVVVARPRGHPIVCEGTCSGVITTEPRGRGGFGYDPIFLVPRYGKTFAELGPETKNRISHRARALGRARRVLARMTLSSFAPEQKPRIERSHSSKPRSRKVR